MVNSHDPTTHIPSTVKGSISNKEFVAAFGSSSAAFPVTGHGAQTSKTLQEPTTQGPTGVARYKLLQKLGQGGFGLVLLAEDLQIGRPVAIKVMLPGTPKEERARLHREALVTGRLEHPGIPPIHEEGITTNTWSGDPWHIPSGQPFFVMRYFRGVSLYNLMHEGHLKELPLPRLLHLFLEICKPLSFAHGFGVLHRDLKPANIMVQGLDDPYVVDWGLAKVPGLEEPFEPGSVVGTPDAMAPEQARGEEVDCRADVYGLGVILYELLTGASLFVFALEETPVNRMLYALNHEPITPQKANSAIPKDLEVIILKALAKDRAARYQSVAELQAVIHAFLEGTAAHERASDTVRLAQGAQEQLKRLQSKLEHAEEHLTALQTAMPSYTTEEKKKPLWYMEEYVATLQRVIAAIAADYVALLHQAVGECPTHTKARALLAAYHKDMWLAAESKSDQAAALHEKLCKGFDNAGAWEALRKGDGRLTFVTVPEHEPVDVFLYRFEKEGKRLKPILYQGGFPTGQTPLNISLAMGSYVLVLKTRHREIRYLVFIPRGHHWKGDVHLDEIKKVQPGFVLVPGGPYWGTSEERLEDPHGNPWRDVKSFAVQQYPVTNGEYCAFLNGLIQKSTPWKEVLSHLPKWDKLHPHFRTWRPWWKLRQGHVELPVGLDPNLPVTGITWHNATAYAAWFSRITGKKFTLPSYPQWVKATCGVDGRAFAWGNEPEATYGNASDAVPPGQAKLLSVKEAPPEDESVYGTRFTVGIMHWLCEGVEGNPLMEVCAGGCFHEDMAGCSPLRWRQAQKHLTHDGAGFRLVQVLN